MSGHTTTSTAATRSPELKLCNLVKLQLDKKGMILLVCISHGNVAAERFEEETRSRTVHTEFWKHLSKTETSRSSSPKEEEEICESPLPIDLVWGISDHMYYVGASNPHILDLSLTSKLPK